MQLLLSSSAASIVPCVCGVLVGAIYDNTSVRTWRFPQWAQSFTRKYISPVLSSNKKKSSTRRAGTIPVRQAPTPPIDEQDIDTMFAMFPNYSRQDIKTALTRSKSDLNRAAEILLTTEPSAGSSSSQ
jgi:hypothetical protein